jgi:hypothetical protein
MVRNLNVRKQSRQAEYDRLGALPRWSRTKMSDEITVGRSHNGATKLAS